MDDNYETIVVPLLNDCYTVGTMLAISYTLSWFLSCKSYDDLPILQMLTDIQFPDQVGLTSNPMQFKLQKVGNTSTDNAAC